MYPHKRKRSRTDIVERLIRMKVKCNFSAEQLKQISGLYEAKDADEMLKIVRTELRHNYSAFRLHGCSQCEEFIWIAGEKMDCDICQNQVGR